MWNRSTSVSRFNYFLNFNFFISNLQNGVKLEPIFSPNINLLRSTRNIKGFQEYNFTSPNVQSCQIQSSSDSGFKSNIRQLSCREGLNDRSEFKPFIVVPKSNSSRLKNGLSTKKLLGQYIRLTKPNLTVLVTLSSICSYAISPNSVSLAELAFLTAGTALCSASANAINMGREPEFDRKMTRTLSRPVVTGTITSMQAFQFSALTGVLGGLILYFGVNPTVAFLGLLNVVLYGWVYTSLKRYSILNTWVGAIVGAIPPLMGWAASTSLTHPGGWCLAALLYAWQFPHFNSLSHNIASQYKAAGYVMTAAENPKLNARVALRYSLLMFPICVSLSYFGVTDWVFPIDSGLANLWLAILAFRFWKQQRVNYKPGYTPSTTDIMTANSLAKKLFWCSVWQLPVVLVLAMMHKKGQWDRIWHYLENGV